MMSLLRWVVWAFGALVFSLRYRVETKGLENVRGMKKAIILPNHPAYMDPPLVIRTLWPALRPRPMLFAGIFRNPLLFWLPRVLDAVEIPDLQQHSAEARKSAEDAIQAVIEGLKAGHNHVFWPAGRVYRSGLESLGAARSLAEVLAAVPDAQIIVVRTRGLWGSMFSYARTGDAPSLPKCLIKGIGILLANGICFAPRRRVEMTIERIDRSKLPGTTREVVNPFFERWYNALGAEKPTHVPYHFLFRAQRFEFPTVTVGADVDPAAVKGETKKQIAQFIAEKLKREPVAGDEEPGAKLEGLGLDSLDRMELSLEVERRFGFTGSTVPMTIGDLWALAEGQAEGKATPPAPKAWFRVPPTESKPAILADTIGEAFVRRAVECASEVAVADDISGVVSYQRMLVGALIMARRIGRVEGANVGLMLPAGVGMNMLFYATHLAGKLPVLLNWTTGPGNLAHAAKVMKLTHVITSRRFIDRTGISVAGTTYIFVEDLKDRIGKVEQVLTLLRVKLRPGAVLRALPKQEANSPAVVLFTSGSEKAPKAVPLTHRNLISNIQGTLHEFDLHHSDVLVGFLPPFHSFGLTVTTLLPVLMGARAVYHPDPTDAAAIARKIGSYKGTVVCGTPTFMSYILERAKEGELASMRMAVVGAEKCPEALYRRVEQVAPGAKLIEGYGITECSPIVAANRLNRIRPGSIGEPFPGVKVRVVEVETDRPVGAGEMGMLWVAGPTIFPGYIGEDAPSPFVECEGERWYVTGDLVRIDGEGIIWFCGRLKRFLKAGGEMISLPAIEEPIAQIYPPADKGPRVAVEGVETEGGRRIVLFTTEAISLRQANEMLQAKGLRGIMRIDEVRQMEAIPVLGTGKTDYKVLRGYVMRNA